LKFLEELYGLPSLYQRDEYVDDLSDCFDFSQRPPRFRPIKLTTRPEDLIDKLKDDTGPATTITASGTPVGTATIQVVNRDR
jgi:hypothetical protein